MPFSGTFLSVLRTTTGCATPRITPMTNCCSAWICSIRCQIFARSSRVTASRHRLFSFTYHSPSLQPGNLAYVQSDDDLRVFLDRFEAFFDFFFGEVGGRAITPLGFRDLALQLKGRPLAAPGDTRRAGLTPAAASS